MFQCKNCEKVFGESQQNHLKQDYLQCLQCGSKEAMFGDGFEFLVNDLIWLEKLSKKPKNIQIKVLKVVSKQVSAFLKRTKEYQ